MGTTRTDNSTVAEEQSPSEAVDEISDSSIVSPLIDGIVLFGLMLLLSLLVVVLL
jgi:hypothetical protein